MSFRKNRELPLGLTYEDLPAWMRRPRRELDWGLLVVVVLCLVIVWPFLTRSGLPRNSSARAEVIRAVEISESIQAGILYPRWAPDFNYGYGSPLWNYLAPLPHYLAGLHRVLAQTHAETSVKGLFILAIGLSGLGMFGFVRQRWGTYAGILAAAVTLYSPQMALVKPYLQSDLPGLLAVGLFPVALWSLDRVLLAGRGRDVALAAFILAALLLTDVPLSLFLTGLAAGWLAWCYVLRYPENARWGRVLVTVPLGIGLCAFYWLPAWIERHDVQWHPVNPPDDLWRSLLPREVLAWPSRLDLSALNPAPTASIGVAVYGLAGIALLVVLAWSWRRAVPVGSQNLLRRVAHLVRAVPVLHRAAFYFVFVGAGVFVLVTPAASALWDQLPAWPPLYPRDLLPVIIICGAVVVAQIGAVLEQVPRPAVAAAGMIIVLGIVLIAALPYLYPPPWSENSLPADVLSGIMSDEVHGYLVASQTDGWLLPRTVKEIPEPSQIVIESYQHGVVDRVARDTLPAAVNVDMVEYNPQSERLMVKASNGVLLSLFILDYPGWQVKVDNRLTSIQAAPSGFITFQVPPGRYEVWVHLESTPARSWGWIISVLALLATGVIAARLEYRANRPVSETEILWEHPPGYLIVIGIAVFGFVIGGSLPHLAPDWFTIRSSPDRVLAAQSQFHRTLQGGIDLLAYDIHAPDAIRPGDDLVVTLYWRAIQPNLPDYQVDLSVVSVDDPGRTINIVRHRQPGGIPASQWPLPDDYVRDVYAVSLAKDVVPGVYQITVQAGLCHQVNLFPCDTIQPLFVQGGEGTSLGQSITLPTLIAIEP